MLLWLSKLVYFVALFVLFNECMGVCGSTLKVVGLTEDYGRVIGDSKSFCVLWVAAFLTIVEVGT